MSNRDASTSANGERPHGDFGRDTTVSGSALLDMYAKCKKLDCSIQFFHGMPKKNWVSRSVIIVGCVQNDDPSGGLELFKEM